MNCEACGREIDGRTETYYQYVEGWGKHRTKGLNAVMDAIWHQRFMCATCTRPREIEGQMSLMP